jgi:ribosomal protein S27AE
MFEPLEPLLADERGSGKLMVKDKAARAAYMRAWNKRHKEAIKQRKRDRINAATVGQIRPCSKCGKETAISARKLAARDYRCSACRWNPEKGRELRRAYRKRYPEKRRAHAAVYRAVRSGKLVRQNCEQCGKPDSQAHHDDYSKPLDVRWLCGECHETEHHPYRQAS